MKHKQPPPTHPGIGPRIAVVSALLAVVLLTFCNCEPPCTEDVQERCKKECDRLGTCLIEYSYNSRGELKQGDTKRTCRFGGGVKIEDCGKCKEVKKDDKGNLLSKSCVICNLCSEDFECLENSECKTGAPICDQGICVGCVKNSDCPKSAPSCQGGTCVECKTDADCSGTAKPQCHNNACVACRCDLVDGGKKPSCLKKSDGTVQCVECNTSEDCDAGKPICKKNTCTSECTEATAAVACGPGKYCLGGACSECRTNGDCKDPQLPRCFNKRCLCTADADCSSRFPLCAAGRCVECSSDGDCTKAPFTLCRAGVCDLKPCKSAGDCTSPPHIKCRRIGRGDFCVQCSTGSDCDDGKSCDTGTWSCR